MITVRDFESEIPQALTSALGSGGNLVEIRSMAKVMGEHGVHFYDKEKRVLGYRIRAGNHCRWRIWRNIGPEQFAVCFPWDIKSESADDKNCPYPGEWP